MSPESDKSTNVELRTKAEELYELVDGNIVIQESHRNQPLVILAFFSSVFGAGMVNAFLPDTIPFPLLFLPALICIALFAHRTWNSRVVLTPEYLLYIQGILSWRQRSIRLDYARIQEIEISETILQKLLGVGDLTATPISTSMEDMISIRGVLNPRVCKDLIREKIKPISSDDAGVHATAHIHAVGNHGLGE